MMTTRPVANAYMKAPWLIFPLPVWQKLHAYVQACPVEINGFGLLDKIGDDYLVTDVVILEQTAGPSHVDNDPEVVAAYMTQLLQQGDDPSRMRLQWHSHVNMGAYFSPTDVNNINRYPGTWMASMVLNKRGDYEARLDILGDFRVNAPLQVAVRTSPEPGVAEQARREVHDLVRTEGVFRRKPVTPNVHQVELDLSGSQLIIEEAADGEHRVQ